MNPDDHDDNLGSDFERIAGALVHAVRRSVRESVDRRLFETRLSGSNQATTLQDSQSNLPIGTEAEGADSYRHPRTPQILESTNNAQQTQGSNTSQSTSAYERALMLQRSTMRSGSSCSRHTGDERRPFRFPSAFKPATKRGRRGSSSREQSTLKPTVYQRDILCLPYSSRREDGGPMQIPRGAPRARLAEVGLLGKVELNSQMTAEEVKSEICQVFMIPMGLSEVDISSKRYFEFNYLQKTGMGSRSLCLPAVSHNFEWNGRQVASLARSGGCIYILAGEQLPGCSLECSPPSSPPSSPSKAEVVISSEDELEWQEQVITVLSDDAVDDLNTLEASRSSGASTSLESRTLSRASTSLESSTLSEANTSLGSSTLSGASTSLGPSTLSGEASTSSGVSGYDDNDLSKLHDMFGENISSYQIESLYKASGGNFTAAMDCLLKGPTLESITKMLNSRFSQCTTIKVRIDPSEAWEDLVVFYKSQRLEVTKQLRIQITGQPVIDAGGVRAQLYTTVLDSFSQNKKIHLFEGPPRRLRPHFTAEARSSGLFKVLGTMVGHALSQDGIGFPFWSPLCYWNMFGDEEQALQHLTMDDVGNDVAVFLTEIRDVSSAKDLDDLMAKDEFYTNAVDIMGRCGIRNQLTLSTRDMIFQDVIMYESLYKSKPLLDQFCHGLKRSGVYDIVSAFAKEFFDLFTYTELLPADVLNALYIVEEEMNDDDDDVIVTHLFRYIRECDESELRQFLCHVTGIPLPVPQSIRLELDDSLEWGTIMAHTCTNMITFPRKVFTRDNESYEMFKVSLKAVTSGSPLLFNTV